MPSRPQLRSSTGPMWRRGAYKLYPPGKKNTPSAQCSFHRVPSETSQKHTTRQRKRFEDTHTHTYAHVHTKHPESPCFINSDCWKRLMQNITNRIKQQLDPQTSPYADAFLQDPHTKTRIRWHQRIKTVINRFLFLILVSAGKVKLSIHLTLLLQVKLLSYLRL